MTEPRTAGERPGTVALVLSGGVALGSFHAGAYAALHPALPPDWVVGASVGAITAAILAGNPPERRVAQLRRFWEGLADDPVLPWRFWLPAPQGGPLREVTNEASILRSHLFGRPGLFRPRAPGEDPTRPGLYDLSPLRARLDALVDWGRLNNGALRVSLTTTDLVSGERVVFDNRLGSRIGAGHVLASGALMPFFAPVEVEGRLLGDGGMSGNLPLDLVLGRGAGSHAETAPAPSDAVGRDAVPGGNRPSSAATGGSAPEGSGGEQSRGDTAEVGDPEAPTSGRPGDGASQGVGPAEDGGDLLCFAVELFSRRGRAPRSFGAAVGRAEDVIFGNQSRRVLEGCQREAELRAVIARLGEHLPPELRRDPAVAPLLREGQRQRQTLLLLEHRASPEEAGGLKVMDFSATSLRERWNHGEQQMRAALRLLDDLPEEPPGAAPAGGLWVHEVPEVPG
ncbi:patatin-like phospholipase family protein [Roseomonas elaeocarpi]|uniref:Patatin-like phospholipase family protein n=1 Tax=Roseomonas elaeocarpi TaxID=907779 RepID=A0ABV6JW07_9PROT